MPPQPPDPTAPVRRPRHAAGVDSRAFAGDASAGTGGRHRRPESLADRTRPRPLSSAPSTNSRSAERRDARDRFDPGRFAPGRFDPGRFEDSFIERGFPETVRADQRRAEAIHLPGVGDSGPRRRARARHASSTRPGGGRGKHAATTDLAITVRPIPAVRDAVVEGLPAAKRAAGAVREWALYTGAKPPVMGTHRAPGTLPIEAWLLVGKSRQQALLATLVAAGLALVMIPIQRQVANPVNAAGSSSVSTGAGQQARAKPPAVGGKPIRQNADPAPARPAQPAAGQSSAKPAAPPESATEEPPLLAVPPGTGPAHSLRLTGSAAIALTFDDGPDPEQTPKILALLDKYQVKATFCLIGRNVEQYPEIVRQIVAAGHTLCNHTWNHSLTIGQDKPQQIAADLDRTSAAIRAAVPGAEIPFFRAPGGYFTQRLVSVAYGAGMTSLHWQVDPKDWDHSSDADDATHTARLIASVQKSVTPGAIILSHDFNQPDTIAAYEKLLPWLTENYEIRIPVPPPLPAEPKSAPASPQPGSEAATDPE